MQDPAALLLAIGALLTAVGTAIIVPIVTLRKARIDREPNLADKTTADAASNDLILKLLSRADQQADRDANTIARQEATINDLQKSIREQGDDSARAVLERHLTRARTELDAARDGFAQAQEEAKRLRLAILRLRELAESGSSFSGHDVIVWANNALDLTVPLNELLQLPDDFDDTEMPAR